MTDKILNFLKSSKTNYTSDEELSKLSGVSCLDIWKHLERLKKEGYDIEIQPHLGYRLVGLPDKLSPFEIKWELNTKIIGREVYVYEQVDSTMETASRLADNEAQEGTVVFAESQTKGRGRMGREWISHTREGIYFSVILKPDITPLEATKVTLLAAVSVAMTIRNFFNLPSFIKWPNDILISGEKICGILTEMNEEKGSVKFLILGIGVNVNSMKKKLPEGATSIMEETGGKVSRINFAREILRNFDKYYLSFKQGGFDSIIEECKKLSSILGNRIEISSCNRKIEGQAQDIDSNGALVVRLDNGFYERVLSGDSVKVR